MRFRLAASLVGAAFLAGAPSQALAGPGNDAKVHVGEFSANFNNESAGEAFCPRHTTVTGGGFGNVEPSPLNVAINVSAPLDSTEIPSQTRSGDRAVTWGASAYSGEGSEVDMKSLAICSASSDGRLRVSSFKVGPVKTVAHTVSCPRGQHALGGGLDIATTPIPGVYLEDSGPVSGRTWKVAAYNGYGVTRKFQALVICSKQTKPNMVVSKTPIMSTADIELQTQCPSGRAVGGGVLVKGKPTSELQFEDNGPLSAAASFAGTTDGDTATYWDGDVYNRSPKTRTFKVIALCA